MQVALPRLDMIIGVVSKASQVRGHRTMVFHEWTEESCMKERILMEMIPLVKLYLLVFSSGKESIKALGSSDYVTATAGELWMCFFASISS
jgi:hypothetical protein